MRHAIGGAAAAVYRMGGRRQLTLFRVEDGGAHPPVSGGMAFCFARRGVGVLALFSAKKTTNNREKHLFISYLASYLFW